MTFGHPWLRHVALGLVLVLGVQSLVWGWADNFDDGSTTDGDPVSWIENPGGFFPGDYNASSGDYVLTPAVDGVDDSVMAAFVNESFTDTYVRTQGIVMPDPNNAENTGGNLVVLARNDPTTLSGYLAYFDVSGNLNIQLLVFGAGTDIGVTFDTEFNAGSEVWLELDVVGDELSAFAWLVGDEKPETPQATATDTTFTAGIAGIAYAEDDDGTFGIFRYAAAQGTPFVDTLPGDENGDGKVDAADYTVIIDQDLGEDAYNTWVDNFGAGNGSGGSAAIPEPAGLLLSFFAVVAGAGLVRLRRR